MPAPNPAAVRAVLFDLDDTLHDDTATYRNAVADVAQGVARSRGIDGAALTAAYVDEAEAFWKNLAAEHLAISLGEERVRMWLSALSRVGLPDGELAKTCADEYNRARRRFLQLWPGVLDLLDRLRSRGCKLGLITNGFAETHREKIELLGLTDAFDALFIADEVGMVKPDPALFRLACERLGVDVSEAVMVGDRYHRDVTGAHDAGLRTIWLDIHGELPAAGDPLPDWRVTSFGQAARELDRLVAPKP